MRQANPQLMEIYGNGMAKTAIPTALRIGAGALGFSMMMQDEEHQRKLMAEADMMDRAIRRMEARKMRATHGGLMSMGGRDYSRTHFEDVDLSEYERSLGPLQGSLFSKGAGVGFIAELGEELANQEMGKEAISFGAVGKVLSKGVSKVKSVFGGARQAAGAARATSTAGKVAPTVPMAAVKPSSGAVSGAATGAVKAPAAAAPGLGGKGIMESFMQPGAAKAAPKKKPLIGWKTKAGLGAAALGTGYAGFKGLQATRDYMMIPAGLGGFRGRGTPGLRHNVSQYGYAY